MKPAAHEDKDGVWVPRWLLRQSPNPAAALFLAQVSWLAQPGLRGRDRARIVEHAGVRWLALSDHELAEQVGLSEDGVYRMRAQLRRAGALAATTAKVEGVKRSLLRVTLDEVELDTAESRDSGEEATAESRNSSTADSRYGNRESAVSFPSIESGFREGEPSMSDPAPEKVDPLFGFPEFWEVYPRRNGKREGRGKAENVWARLDIEERRAAWRAARNYGLACDSGLTLAADAFRWLRDRRWDDWQEPAKPSAPRNGHRPATPIADHLAMQFDAKGNLVR